jgi:hypothetical protein
VAGALALLAWAAVTACGGAAERPPAGDAVAARADAGDPEAEASLRSLPYGRWVPVAADDLREGVVLHEGRAAPGLNLFNTRHVAQAFLVDMEGRTVHRWRAPAAIEDAFQHVEPAADGGLVGLVKDRGLLRLDADSRLLWTRDLPAHHDVALLGDGGMWVPSRLPRWVDHDGERLPILEDRLTRLDAEGGVLEHVGLWELFGGAVPERRWRAIRDWVAATGGGSGAEVLARVRSDSPPDLFHLNSVEVLERPVPGLGRPGDLLISIRELDTVAVLDPGARRVRWRWGPGHIERQHHPSVTDAGTVLLFDNGRRRGWSRVVEVDPATAQVVWEYRATPPESFFSFSRGAAQRLPNGNTLITESDAGRVMEVTPAGEVVWELLGPRVPAAAGRPPRRAAIYRLRRMPADWWPPDPD